MGYASCKLDDCLFLYVLIYIYYYVCVCRMQIKSIFVCAGVCEQKAHKLDKNQWGIVWEMMMKMIVRKIIVLLCHWFEGHCGCEEKKRIFIELLLDTGISSNSNILRDFKIDFYHLKFLLNNYIENKNIIFVSIWLKSVFYKVSCPFLRTYGPYLMLMGYSSATSLSYYRLRKNKSIILFQIFTQKSKVIKTSAKVVKSEMCPCRVQ